MKKTKERKYYNDCGQYVCTFIEQVKAKKGKKIRKISLKPIAKREEYNKNSII